jgi:cell division GTPase FtsZ
VRQAATDETNIIFGATIDERLAGQVWVTVVATGLGGHRGRAPRSVSPSAPRPPRDYGDDVLEPPSFLRD